MSVPASPMDFRRAIARMSSGVCVVASRLHGHDHAMTATAFMSVSLDPLLVVVSIGRDARMVDAIEATGQFSVSVLNAGQRPIAEWLATPGRPVINQLAQVAHRPGDRGPILIDDALAAFECSVHAVHEGGDHLLVVGEVEVVEVGPPELEPLVYFDGGYRRVT